MNIIISTLYIPKQEIKCIKNNNKINSSIFLDVFIVFILFLKFIKYKKTAC